jgi:regulator of sigma E protease
MDILSHNLLPFIGILVVLIVVHELGHFITAKLAGVKVLEFGLGYPPRLAGIKRGETEYTINALPLGGFVRLLGEEDPSDPRSLAAKPRWIRLVVLGAGAVMNVFLAIVLFSLALMIPRTVDVSRAAISHVIPGSPADTAGLKSGDVIFKVDGHDVKNTNELGYQIRLRLGQTITMTVRRVEGGAGAQFVDVPVNARWSTDAFTYVSALAPTSAVGVNDPLPIKVNVTTTTGFDDGSTLLIDPGTAKQERFEYCVKDSSTLFLTKRAVGGTQPAAHAAGAPIEHSVGQGPTGIAISPAYTVTQPLTEAERAKLAKNLTPCQDTVPRNIQVPISASQSEKPWNAVPDGARRSWESLILARNEIVSRLRGGLGGESGFQVTGPVGIAQLTGQVVKEAGWKSLMDFAALLSMNLAVLNILPLPMLDGGRVVFVLLEYARRGRRIAPEKEAMVHFVGLIAMLTLAVVITYFDVARLFGGGGLIR